MVVPVWCVGVDEWAAQSLQLYLHPTIMGSDGTPSADQSSAPSMSDVNGHKYWNHTVKIRFKCYVSSYQFASDAFSVLIVYLSKFGKY